MQLPWSDGRRACSGGGYQLSGYEPVKDWFESSGKH
jgi:hypothetical protein